MRRLDRRDNFNDLFKQMEDFFNQFQEFGRDVAGGMKSSVPVDIHEEDGEYTISADLPGVEKEEINVKADENHVEISADVNQEVKEENEQYVRRERTRRSYRRKVAWPEPVDPDTVTAEYDQGVLHVSAEKQEDSGKRVSVE